MPKRVTAALLRDMVAGLNDLTALEPRYTLRHYSSTPILYSPCYRGYTVFSSRPARELYDLFYERTVSEIDAMAL